jgi:SHS2 domain-containing protein
MSHSEGDAALAPSGHRLLPHTADVMVSAWAPTVEGCLAQAVRGMVSCFAEIRNARPQRMIPFVCEPALESELLVELLEEAIYVIDAQDAIPVQVAVARTAEGGLVGEFGLAARADVELIGPAPKAVTRHGLRFGRDGPIWRCEVIVDV